MSYKRLFLLSILGLFTHAVAAQELILAVKGDNNTFQEGGSATDRFSPLAKVLEKELKRPVRVQAIDHYSDFEKGLKAERFDLAFVDPAKIGLRAVKSGKYVGLVTAKGFTDYRARVMVNKDSPLQGWADVRDKKIGVPSMDSNATVMFSAALVDLGYQDTLKNFTAIRYQEAVPFMIEKGFVDAGVAASGAIVNDWIAKGGRVIAETKPIPIKQFIASSKLSDEEREKVRQVMLKLADTNPGKVALKGMGMKGFVVWDNSALDDATKRLGL